MYRIFIVEDDRTIAQAVAHLAESWGLEVRCVRDFRAVTAEAAEFQPHLIILDIALPCFDGYHWCRELRKQTSAPILFLSSAGDNMNVIMAMNFGADDFIAKPFDGGVLMAKVQAMLRRSYDMAAPAVLRERRGAQLSADDQKLTYQADGGADQERVPYFVLPDGERREGGQPGEADAAAMGDGQLCG